MHHLPATISHIQVALSIDIKSPRGIHLTPQPPQGLIFRRHRSTDRNVPYDTQKQRYHRYQAVPIDEQFHTDASSNVRELAMSSKTGMSSTHSFGRKIMQP
jgi:hypothetical protein